ncbi:MAG: GNAT family N-acetyltransferase [Firmicutes bacterium]|nr:GNAT family N-acetyltransferase [Bacillota bacterium]
MLKREIIERIEGQHWDYEKEFKFKGLIEKKNSNLLMRKLENSNSIYSNKVVKFQYEKNTYKKIDLVIQFFNDKKFSWWIGPNTKPNNLKNILINKGFTIVDEYIGLGLELKKWSKLDLKNSFKVKEASSKKHIKDHVSVSREIWGLDTSSSDTAFKQRLKYFNLKNKRGNFLIAYDNYKAIGNASYRFSEDGLTIYLIGAAVLDKYRNNGVYTKLLAHRLNKAKDNGCELATVLARKESSEPILKKNGFKDFGTFYLLKKE